MVHDILYLQSITKVTDNRREWLDCGKGREFDGADKITEADTGLVDFNWKCVLYHLSQIAFVKKT